MAFSLSTAGCLHSIDRPYRGMRMVGRDDRTVTFDCPVCGDRYVAARCAATARKSGAPCLAAARVGFSTCRMHRHDAGGAE